MGKAFGPLFNGKAWFWSSHDLWAPATFSIGFLLSPLFHSLCFRAHIEISSNSMGLPGTSQAQAKLIFFLFFRGGGGGGGTVRFPVSGLCRALIAASKNLSKRCLPAPGAHGSEGGQMVGAGPAPTPLLFETASHGAQAASSLLCRWGCPWAVGPSASSSRCWCSRCVSSLADAELGLKPRALGDARQAL